MAENLNIQLLDPDGAEEAFKSLEQPAETPANVPEAVAGEPGAPAEEPKEEKITDGYMYSPEEIEALKFSHKEGQGETPANPVERQAPASPGADNEEGSEKAAPLQAFVNDFVKRGILTVEEGTTVESIEDVAKILEDTVQERVQTRFEGWQDKLGEDEKAVLGLMNTGLAPAEAQQLAKVSQEVNSMTEDMMEDDKVAEAAYRRSLKVRDFSQAEIDDYVETAIGQDKLKTYAKKALPALKSHYNGIQTKLEERAAEARDKAKQKSVEQLEKQQSYIDSAKEYFEGFELTDNMKKTLKDSFTTAVYTDPKSGNKYNAVTDIQRQNPEGFNVALHYLTHMGILNFDETGNFKPDMSVLKTLKTTKVTSELEESLETERSGVGSTASKTSQVSALDAIKGLASGKK